MSHNDVSLIKNFSTACLSDAMDRLGIGGQVPGIYPLDRTFQLCGSAYTLQYEPIPPGESGSVGDFIDDIPAGDVAVLANAGRLDATIWGDLMTRTASRERLGGTVIDGVCRDTACAIELSYPIFSSGHWMRTGKDRVRLTGILVPVEIVGIPVSPGDVLRGDADGLVVIPQARVAEVAEIAEAIEAAEVRIRQLLERGSSLVDARVHTDYHTLQTRQS